MGKALVIVDMLNDFVDENGALPVEGARGLVENIGKIKGTAGEYGVFVVYANDAHSPEDIEFKKWPRHCVKGEYGAEVIDKLTPRENDLVIEKQDLSVFTNPETDKLLRERGIDELIVTGVATEYCVRGAVLDGLELKYKVNVVVDGIAGVDEIVLPDGTSVPGTKGAEARSLIEMGNVGARPMYTAQVLEEIVK